jgi:hypothetical protein
MIRFNLFSLTWRRFFVLVSTAILFGGGIWFLNHTPALQGYWYKYYTEAEMGTFFCERTNLDHFIRQPLNTFSNFIYWLTAIVIINRGWKDRTKKNRYNIISANPFYSFTLGGIMLYIFCASVFFHSSLIHVASELDFSAVYSLSLFPLMYFSHRVWLLRLGIPSNTRHMKSTLTLATASTIAYLLLTFFLPQTGRNFVVLGIIVLILTFGIIVERYDRGRTNHYYLVTCMLSIMFAVMWFGFDVHKVLCDPDSIIQPHSLWHLFSGISVFYFYMYIRSEKNKI